jgi:hypothetical protein
MSSGEAAHKCLNGRREMRPGPSLLTGADYWTFPRHAVKVYRLGPHILPRTSPTSVPALLPLRREPILGVKPYSAASSPGP